MASDAPDSTRSPRPTIAVIEDDERFVRTVVRSLGSEVDVIVDADGDALLRAVERGDLPDVLLCDVHLATRHGVDLCDRLTSLAPTLASRIVMMSGDREAMARSSSRRLKKPFTITELKAAIADVLDRSFSELRPRLRLSMTEVELGPGTTTVGRDATCSLTLDDAAASRIHARIFVDDDSIAIVDCQSRNGVFVNGRRIDGRSPLEHGDRIRIGVTEMVLTMRERQRVARSTGKLVACNACGCSVPAECPSCPFCSTMR